MCGISGILSPLASEPAIRAMSEALAHRGPDDSGFYAEPGLALAHRRLSIIDLTAAGHQPMSSPDGRYTLVFNGEIYNFRQMREELDYPFRSHTDSEVLLAAWQQWGPDCIERLIGMFAFAVWDSAEKTLFLVRDRLGIKPLYYYLSDDRFLFASEVRSLLASDLVPRRLHRPAVADYLRFQTVHAPDTLVEGVQLLAPGHYLRIRGRDIRRERYWSPVRQTFAYPPDTPPDLVQERVLDALRRAVERRLVADVPFGAFLSGGIDSSAVVALMAEVASGPVNTFCVTFDESDYSEARFARLVADKYHTHHHEIHLSPQNFLDLLPQALDAMDHPSGDGPNTYVVAKATRDAGIAMALSGLGGDELFAGYDLFKRIHRLHRNKRLAYLRVWRRQFANILNRARPSISSYKIAQLISKPDWEMESVYSTFRQVWFDGQIQTFFKEPLPADRPAEILRQWQQDPGYQDLPFLSRISLAEMSTYMSHVLLRDTDQMSMAHPLEVRVPFLDHELVELVLGIPDSFKYPLTPKKLLVDALGHRLPPEVVNRPKMGFTLPFQRWMKRELRDFCETRLHQLGAHPPFDEHAIMGFWGDFLLDKPTVSWSRIWTLVVLSHWLQKNGVS